MNIIIVEDSRLARNELRELLKQSEQYKIIGEASSVAEACQLIDENKPDLILLDIQLPDGDGFDLLEKLHHIPQVIFTTAYNQHAVAAFEVNALDYLLKPIEKDRLLQSLQRAKQTIDGIPDPKTIKSRQDKIFIRDGEQCFFVQLAKVFMFEVDGNYTRVYFDGKRPLISRSLQYLEQRIDPQVFFRANRQVIINLDFIDTVEPWVTDGLLIKLINGKEIEVSRRQTKNLLRLLEM